MRDCHLLIMAWIVTYGPGDIGSVETTLLSLILEAAFWHLRAQFEGIINAASLLQAMTEVMANFTEIRPRLCICMSDNL
jgi:hypothetical protein